MNEHVEMLEQQQEVEA
ncbi:hypothetical protein SEA_WILLIAMBOONE_172 [Gordonia phage WilliamBoone]|nr:hypothetical protein SEA_WILLIAMBOONE_172 [Gordonia phage WilliamBoone]